MNFTSKQYSKYNNNNNNNNQSPKPFCPICKKNGRPEAEYNSHFIRATSDENSAITCPILLDMECNHCGEKGHLVARCPKKKCVFCNEFGHTVSRCTAGTQQEIDRFLDERHNNYVQRRDNVFIRNDIRNAQQRMIPHIQIPRIQIPRIQIPQLIEEDNFPSLSNKPVREVESVKGYANIATIAAPLAAPKPVLKKPVAKPVEEEYETDDEVVDDDNDSVYSSKIPDDDNW